MPYECSTDADPPKSLRLHGGLLLLLELVVHVVYINGMNNSPSVLGDVVQVVDTTGVGIPVGGMVDGTLTKVDGLIDGKVGAVVRVQNAVGIGGTGSDGKVGALEASAVIVDVVQLRAGFVPTGNHGAHAEAVAAVGVHGVGQKLGGGRDGDALAVAQLVHAALGAEVALPEGAVGGTAGHGTEEEGVDLDDLLDGLGGDVGAHGGPGVDRHDDALVEFEGEGGGTLGELDELVGVLVTGSGGKVVAAELGGLFWVYYCIGAKGARRERVSCSKCMC